MSVFLAAVIYILMVVLIGFSVYEDPITLGIGLLLFVAGVPVYFVTKYLQHKKPVIRLMSACLSLITIDFCSLSKSRLFTLNIFLFPSLQIG